MPSWLITVISLKAKKPLKDTLYLFSYDHSCDCRDGGGMVIIGLVLWSVIVHQ